jgi:hypothetical protein
MKIYPSLRRAGSQIVAYDYIKHLSKKYLISLVCLQKFKSKRNMFRKRAKKLVVYLAL